MAGLEFVTEQLSPACIFVAANFPVVTDFTIILGAYEWKVRANVMSKASSYFNTLCNGGFQEAGTRKVRLEHDNPCDFARLLQFVHTKEYDQKPGGSNASKEMPLDGFVSKEDLSREGWATEKPRDLFEIDKAVLELARYYDIPSLREFIAVRLVAELPSSGYSPESRALFQVEYVKVFKAVSEDLGEMPEINERMVDEVLNFWVREYDVRGQAIPPLLDTGEWTARSDKEEDRNFGKQLEGFIKDNGSFALEMMLGTLRIARQGLENFKWSGRRVDRLIQYRPIEVDHSQLD